MMKCGLCLGKTKVVDCRIKNKWRFSRICFAAKNSQPAIFYGITKEEAKEKFRSWCINKRNKFKRYHTHYKRCSPDCEGCRLGESIEQGKFIFASNIKYKIIKGR